MSHLHRVTAPKLVKVIGVCIFVISCTAVACGVVIVPTSPLSQTSAAGKQCSIKCAQTDSVRSNSDCLQCVFTAPVAFLTCVLLALVCFFFVVSMCLTAFTDPGELSAAPDTISETDVVRTRIGDANVNHENEDEEGDDDAVSLRRRPTSTTSACPNDEKADSAAIVSSQPAVSVSSRAPTAGEEESSNLHRGADHVDSLARPGIRRYRWETSAGKSDICVWSDATATAEFVHPPLSSSRTVSMTVSICPRLRHCNTCGINRPPRAAHCRHCHVCVREFSLHCLVTDSCIGEDNVAPYRGIIYASAVLSSVILWVMSYSYGTILLDMSVRSRSDFESAQTAALTLIIFAAFSTLPLVAMALFHVRLQFCLGGMTVREFVRRGVVFSGPEEFATQFDDPCSKLVRSAHCGRGGFLGDVMTLLCGCCFLFGKGADRAGPTCCPSACVEEFDVTSEEGRYSIVPRPCRAV